MNTHVDTIEQSVFIRLVLLEDPHVFEHLRIHFDLFEVPDRVFTQEIKAKDVGGLQRNVFAAERATAHGIGLVLALFVTSSKSENIDEVHGRGPLPICHLLRLEFFPIIRTDPIDMALRYVSVNNRSVSGEILPYLQFARLFELGHITLPLEGTTGSEENILVVLVNVLDPVGKPCDRVVVDYLFPRSRGVGFGDGLMLTDVDRDVLRADAFLGTETLDGRHKRD